MRAHLRFSAAVAHATVRVLKRPRFLRVRIDMAGAPVALMVPRCVVGEIYSFRVALVRVVVRPWLAPVGVVGVVLRQKSQ